MGKQAINWDTLMSPEYKELIDELDVVSYGNHNKKTFSEWVNSSTVREARDFSATLDAELARLEAERLTLISAKERLKKLING